MPIFFIIKKFINKKSVIFFKKNKLIINRKQKIILIILIILIVLLSDEFYLRYKYRNFESILYQYTIENFDPFLQFKMTDSYTTNVNSQGFRGQNISKVKKSGTYRIFILGGSTVLNRGTQFKKISSRILEKKLQKRFPDKKVEVMNAGVDGYTTEHSIIQYLFKIKDFDPDLIIMWHGYNDWAYSCSPPDKTYGDFKSDYSHYLSADATMVFDHFRPQPLIAFKSLAFDFFIRFLQDNWYSDVFKYYQKNSSFQGYFTESTKSRQYDLNDLPSLKSYERNLQSLINILKADNIELIIGNQPNLLKNKLNIEEQKNLFYPGFNCTINGKYPSLQSVTKDLQLFNNSTKIIAKKNNVNFIDLDRSIPKTLDYYTDEVHYTEKGNQKIADILFNYILENRIISDK